MCAPSVTTIDSSAPDSDTAGWVLAAPFRAHLTDLIDGSALPWRAVAIHADIPVRAARSLLFGRCGRRMHRISPLIATRILCVRVCGLIALDRIPGHSWLAHHCAVQLTRIGRSPAELALLAGAGRDAAESWITGPPGWVSARSVLLLRTACHAAGMIWFDPSDPWEEPTSVPEVA